MYKLYLISILLVITLCSFGQQKQVDKLERFYSKGLYETCYDRGQHFLKKFEQEPEIHLYVALSGMKMIRNGNAGNAAEVMDNVLAHTHNSYHYGQASAFKKHKKDSGILQGFIKSYADNLYAQSPTESEPVYELLALVFKDTSDNYRELLNPSGVVVNSPSTKPNKPGKPNKPNKPNKPKPVTNPPKNEPAGNLNQENLIAYAETFMGTPYKYAGCGPGGFDCSGYVHYVYKHFGIELPRSSKGLSIVGERIGMDELQPGDLIFFGEGKGNQLSIQHVAIVHSVGEGSYYSMIHSSSRGVTIDDPMSTSWDYWQKRFLFVRRPQELLGYGLR